MVYDLKVWDYSARKQVSEAYTELLKRVEWSLFATMTFDPKRYPRSSEMVWISSWRWFLFTWMKETALDYGQLRVTEAGRYRGPFINAWRRGQGRPMWVLAFEPHRDNRLHCHVLMKLKREMNLDWKKGCDIWYKNRGICWFEKPVDQHQVCNYVTKYFSKSGTSDAFVFSENFDSPKMGALVG